MEDLSEEEEEHPVQGDGAPKQPGQRAMSTKASSRPEHTQGSRA